MGHSYLYFTNDVISYLKFIFIFDHIIFPLSKFHFATDKKTCKSYAKEKVTELLIFGERAKKE